MRYFVGLCFVLAFGAMVVLVASGHWIAVIGFGVIIVGGLQTMKGTQRAREGGSDGSDVQTSGISKLRGRNKQ